MYAESQLQNALEQTLDYQTEVIVEEVVKNEAGEITAYKAQNPLNRADDKQLVYIAPRNLKKEKASWIDKPYENVDYS